MATMYLSVSLTHQLPVQYIGGRDGLNHSMHLNYCTGGSGASLVNFLVAVQNLNFLSFPLGILLEFMYEMNTARRDLPNNDIFGVLSSLYSTHALLSISSHW